MRIAGVLLILAGVLFPVDLVADRAIAPHIARQILEQSGAARLQELQEQFRLSLMFLRIAFGLLGSWLLFVGLLWKVLMRWVADVAVPGAGRVHEQVSRVELLYPLAWAVIIIALGVPMLFKGLDSIELINFVMMAERGPLVTMACQNLPPRAAQIGYTVLVSLLAKVLDNPELAARLPALVLGALVAFPVFSIARRYGSIVFANLVCGGMAATGFYHFYNTYGRGYAMALLAYLVCTNVALKLRESSTWRDWIVYVVPFVVACYTHLASGLYLGLLTLLLLLDRALRVRREDARLSAILKSLVQPGIVLGTAFFVIAVLYSVGIPSSRAYMRHLSLTEYYMAYHVNLRLLRVMAESWAWLRDAPPAASIQAVLVLFGVVMGARRRPWTTAYLLAPLAVSVVLIWSRGLYVFTRYFIHFLPAYVLFAILPLWALVPKRLRAWRAAMLTIVAAFLVGAGVHSMKRLYSMERQGVLAAVRDTQAMKAEGETVMVVLDPYVTARHYDPTVVSGYTDRLFLQQISSDTPPEFIISVPYLDYDIPGGTEMLAEKYELIKAYPSWLDVDDNQDSILLYRLKAEERDEG